MILTDNQLEHLFKLAGRAAQQAGEYIAKFDREAIRIDRKTAGDSLASQVVTQVDLACEQIIFNLLNPTCEAYDIAFLGEESAANFAINEHPRLSKPYFWCVDPLDGTLPFTENVSGYAVSISLVNKAGTPVLAAVYDPVNNNHYQALTQGSNKRLLKNGKAWSLPVPAEKSEVLHLYLDRSFTQAPNFDSVIAKLKANGLPSGIKDIKIHNQLGAVMNAIHVLECPLACYFKFPKDKPGGGSLWDFAATTAITNIANAWVSDMHKQALDLNSDQSLFMNKRGVLFASNEAVADLILSVYQSFY